MSTKDDRPTDVVTDPATAAPTEVDLGETKDDARSVRTRAAVPMRLADRYELGALLGEGGMGEVLECRDRVLERSAALKIIRRDRRAPQLEARFIREACVQAQLEHPCVVPVYDVDRDAEGSPFFTMRKVDGITLDQIITRTRAGDRETIAAFPRHRLLTAFAQVCLTIDYAHARGVLHRDLKPANVMFGDFGEVYVLDWGLAKLTLAEASPLSARAGGSTKTSQKTQAGSALGTPAYMPPEQFVSFGLDERADVFALGAVLFEILTLEPLFDEAAVTRRAAGETITWDARPSARAPLREVAPEFDRICVRATAAAVDKRYPSARALHDAIEAYLGGERDVELRRTLASSHFARAEAARSSDRDLAIVEVRRALALTPDDPRGLELLVALLKETPSASAQAREDVVSEGIERLRRAQPLAAVLLIMPWLTVYPALWAYRGVNSVWMGIVVPVAWIIAAISILIDHRQRSQARVTYPTYALMLAIAATSLLLGPMFVVPALALTIVANHVMMSVRRLRSVTVVLGCAAVVVPTALAWAGVYDVYRFSSESTIAVHGIFRTVNAVNFGVLLTFMDLVMLFSTGLFASQFRDEIEQARTKNALFVWQLAKLLPAPISRDDDASAAAVRELAIRSVAGLLETEIDRTPIARSSSGGSSSIISTPGDDEESGIGMPLVGRRYEPSSDATTYRDRLIGREVVMKRMPANVGTREDLELSRFSREALLQARLDHPAIPAVYDLGQDEQGPWFTSRVVRGTSLAELFEREPAEAAARHRRLAAFAQVCLALELAHARGIVHGALEPSRIVLGEFGEVYVTGWSHAATRSTDGVADNATSIAAGAYAAPEQAAAGRVDGRTDVFALGAILYELACGKPLFQGEERLDRVFGNYDPRPSARAAEGNVVPRELDVICARACAYDPADRYPSARELHDALDALMSRDRDEVLRVALGKEHLALATKSADRVILSLDESARMPALQELGRALALLTDRKPALQVLERLLRWAPSPLPPAVAHEIATQASSISRRPAPAVAKASALAALIGFPLLAWLAGVRDATAAMIIAVAWLVAAAAAHAQRAFAGSARFPWAAVAGLVACASTSLLFGPYILGTTATIAMTMGYVLGGRLEWRRLVIALGAIAIVVPASLTWARVLDVFEARPENPGLTIVLRGAIYHPRDVLLGGLMIVNGLAVLIAAAYAASFRDALAEIEAENRAKALALSRLLS